MTAGRLAEIRRIANIRHAYGYGREGAVFAFGLRELDIILELLTEIDTLTEALRCTEEPRT